MSDDTIDTLAPSLALSLSRAAAKKIYIVGSLYFCIYYTIGLLLSYVYICTEVPCAFRSYV